MRKVFRSSQLPKYHSNLLLVRTEVTTVATGRVAAVAGRGSRTMRPGILQQLEQSGDVVSVADIPMRGGMIRARGIARAAGAGNGLSRSAIVEFKEGSKIDQIVEGLKHSNEVVDTEKVPARYLTFARTMAVPPSGKLWNLEKVQWSEARSSSAFVEASDVKIAVLDTGVDANHPDLAGIVAKYIHDHPEDASLSTDKDIVGHGTHVSGTITAKINNTMGIDGICQCQLMVWKIFTDTPEFFSVGEGYGYVVDPIMYRRALADCLDEGVAAINLSIGGSGEPDSTEAELFQQLIDSGVAVVAAMGNERSAGSPTSYPAAIKGVIAVGATGIQDRVTSFSNRGSHICLTAPGQGIWSTLPTYAGQTGFRATIGSDGKSQMADPDTRETDYDAWDGTSMATPHVTGSCALLRARGQLSPKEIFDTLQKTADKVSGMRGQAFNEDYGAGRLNLRNLLSKP